MGISCSIKNLKSYSYYYQIAELRTILTGRKWNSENWSSNRFQCKTEADLIEFLVKLRETVHPKQARRESSMCYLFLALQNQKKAHPQVQILLLLPGAAIVFPLEHHWQISQHVVLSTRFWLWTKIETYIPCIILFCFPQ